MKTAVWFGCLVVLNAAGALAAPMGDAAPGTPWENIYESDGVKVSRRSIGNNPLFEFRGEGDVDAPIEKVAAVLRDTSRAKEWVDSVVEIKHLRTVNDYERIEYYRIAVPWPLQDRDFVYHTKVEIDKNTQTIVFSSRSVEDSSMGPVPGLVRGEIFNARLILTPTDHGRKTHAIGEAHTDPKGAIPTWLVNLVQKNWPYNTFMNVRKQVRKTDIAPDPLFAELAGIVSTEQGAQAQPK